MQNPRTAHLIAAKRIVRYLKGTMHQSLDFKKTTDPKLFAYCDTNGVAILTGACIYYGTNLVSWIAKKHTMVVQGNSQYHC